MTKINPNQCPLCGSNNACGSQDTNPCWCCSTNIPQSLLDLVPNDKKMKACICKNCISRAQQEQQQQ